MKNIIIIDANFILLPIQFNIHYLEEIKYQLEGNTKFLIFEQILDELKAKKHRKKMAKKNAKFEMQYKAGLQYLQKNQTDFNLEFIALRKKPDESSDDFLLRKALEIKKEEKSVFLASNDANLRKRAKKQGISVIFLRQKNRIAIR